MCPKGLSCWYLAYFSDYIVNDSILLQADLLYLKVYFP